MRSNNFFRNLFWGVVALLFVFHVAGGWYYSSRMIEEGLVPDPDPIAQPSGEYVVEPVTYQSDIGDLDAWYMPASGTTWVVHVHGLNATPAEPEVLFAPLQGAGYPQLSLTYRNDEGQPTDPSGYHRYGATEWADMLGAMEYARANGAERVVFAGYSTGASHVLSFAYRHAFDDLAGIILDSANIDFGSTIDYRASIEPLPLIPANVPVTVSWVAKFFTSMRADINWKSLDYIDRSMRSLRVPVLAIHGAEDESIPLAQSQELAEVQPDLVKLVVVEGAGHVSSFDSDRDRYLSEVLAFLSSVR